MTLDHSNGLKVMEEVARLQKDLWQHGELEGEGGGGGEMGGQGDGEKGRGGGGEESALPLIGRLCRILLARLQDEELTMR